MCLEPQNDTDECQGCRFEWVSSGLWQDDVWIRRTCTGTEGAPLLISAGRRPSRFPPHSDRRQPFSPQTAACHQRARGRRDGTSLRRPACSARQKNAVSNYLEPTFQRRKFSDKPVLQLQHCSCRCQGALLGLHLFALTSDHQQLSVIFICTSKYQPVLTDNCVNIILNMGSEWRV